MDIQAIRERIDAVDLKMAELFEERLDLVYQVAEYKCQHDEEIFDSQRESEIIEKNQIRIKNQAYRKAYREFIHMIMDQSKAVQKQYIDAQK